MDPIERDFDIVTVNPRYSLNDPDVGRLYVFVFNDGQGWRFACSRNPRFDVAVRKTHDYSCTEGA